MIVRLVGLLAAMALGADAACPDGTGQWVSRAPLATARQEVGAARIGGNVYVIGGLLANFQATPTVEAYDIALDQWAPVAAMPAARDHMAVVAIGGILYVAGGFAGDFQARDELFAYDPGTNVWTTLAPMPAPSAWASSPARCSSPGGSARWRRSSRRRSGRRRHR